MTLAETPPSAVHQVHPGGFFWNIERSERAPQLMRFVAQTTKLAVVANTVREAEKFAERLTLSGVPVVLATDAAKPEGLTGYCNEDEGPCVLIATHDVALSHGPMPSPMTVHLRSALSVRDYTKRLDALQSPVHLSFVVPEDQKRAASLLSHFGNDHGHGTPNKVHLGEVIDLTDGNVAAMVSHARRRFPLGR